MKDQDSAAAEVLRLEDERYAAMPGKDVKALERLLDEQLVYMHSSGGDTALVFNRLAISIKVRGVQKELDNRALAVRVRRGGAWRLVALQSGAVPKP